MLVGLHGFGDDGSRLAERLGGLGDAPYARLWPEGPFPVEIREDGSLRWYQSSSKAKRGFCGHCGSSLFWSHAEKDSLSIAAGALDMPTGLATGAHIFFDDASDYYRVHPDEATLDGSSF